MKAPRLGVILLCLLLVPALLATRPGAANIRQQNQRAESQAGPPTLGLEQGYLEFDTPDFKLKLVRASQTAAALQPEGDPVFGRFCFGGDWRKTAAGLEVTPKDGVRRRFHALLGEGEGSKLHMALDTDRFAAAQPVVLKEDLSEVRFRVESDNAARHVATLRLSVPAPGSYVLRDGDRTLATIEIKDGQETPVELPMDAGARPKTFTISRRAVAHLSR